jgi:MFS family permease
MRKTDLSYKDEKNDAIRKIAFLFLASFIVLLAFNMQSPTLSLFAVESGASLIQIGLIVSTGFIVRFLSRVPIGLLSDRFGRKSLFSFGAICVFASFLVLYLSSSPFDIMASQVLYAIAFTTLYSMGMTIAAEMYSTPSGTGVSAFAFASSIAGLSAPLLCSALLLRMPIRTTYFIAVIIGTLGVASCLLLPKGHNVRKSFEIRQSLQSVFKNKGVQLVSSVQIFTTLSVDIAIGIYFPLRGSQEIGLSPSLIALLLSIFNLGMTLIRIPLPKILEKTSANRILMMALAAYAITMLAIPLVRESLLLAIFIGIAGLAHGVIWPAASLHLSHSVDSQDLGLANAIYGGTGDLVGVIAPVALSPVIELMGYSAVYYAAFLFDLAGLVMLSLWNVRQHKSQ